MNTTGWEETYQSLVDSGQAVGLANGHVTLYKQQGTLAAILYKPGTPTSRPLHLRQKASSFRVDVLEAIEPFLDGDPLKLDTRGWSYHRVLDWSGLRSALGDINAQAGEPKPPRIDWTRDELTLALDLYFKHDGTFLDDNHPDVIELSKLLKRLAVALGIKIHDKYRNPNGVSLKLVNFRRFDPRQKESGSVGMQKGNKEEGPIWDTYYNDRERLRAVAETIRKAADGMIEDLPDLSGPDEPDIAEAPEGKVLTKLHRYRERNRKLVAECKKQALKNYKKLACVGCNMDFASRYGSDLGHIIDCHHTKPVHTLTDGETTKIEDLILLCANCHRVVHASRQWLTLDQLRARVAASEFRAK